SGTVGAGRLRVDLRAVELCRTAVCRGIRRDADEDAAAYEDHARGEQICAAIRADCRGRGGGGCNRHASLCGDCAWALVVGFLSSETTASRGCFAEGGDGSIRTGDGHTGWE